MDSRTSTVSTPSLKGTNGAGSGDESGPPSPKAGAPGKFARVEQQIYRSSFPQDTNISFLQDEVKAKTIITFVSTPLSERFVEYMRAAGINHYRIIIPPHKSTKAKISEEKIAQILCLLTDPSNQPVLIHCNKGKHRTGCMAASYRLLQGFLHPSTEPTELISQVIKEYESFAAAKARELDRVFIRNFSPDRIWDMMKALKEPVQPVQYHCGDRDISSLSSMSSTPPSPLERAITLGSQPGHDIQQGPNPQSLTHALENLTSDSRHQNSIPRYEIDMLPPPYLDEDDQMTHSGPGSSPPSYDDDDDEDEEQDEKSIADNGDGLRRTTTVGRQDGEKAKPIHGVEDDEEERSRLRLFRCY